MAEPAAIDPHARTATPVDSRVDSRADTIPSDGAEALRLRRTYERDPMIGRVLGHFRVDALVGEGGMGAVYRAWDTSLLRPVALKVVLADSASARSRFLREARAQAQLRHANVVPIHYVGDAEGVVFLVMDLVEGESLADLLRREPRLAAERALDIADGVASALEAGANTGLIHRDVKPSNILLEKGGRTLLADFGLAKEITSADLPPPSTRGEGRGSGAEMIPVDAAITREGMIVGTPAYLAPEQGDGASVDHRADMYALGVTLYEALTGSTPFTGATPTAVVEKQRTEEARAPRLVEPGIHPSVERLIVRMMQKRPDDRFATWAELRLAITAARATPVALAPFFPRAVAFGVDLVAFGVIAGLGTWALRLAALGWGVAALVAALIEWRFGTTPGKKLMHLRTVDRFGLTAGFGLAVARAQIKYAGPTLTSLIGVLLPDGIVARVLTGLAMVSWLAGFAIALGRRRAALHDRVVRTQVVYAVEPKPQGVKGA